MWAFFLWAFAAVDAGQLRYNSPILIKDTAMKQLYVPIVCLLVLLSACQPQSNAASPDHSASKPQDDSAKRNGYAADFEQQYVTQCLKEQTSVNVDTKIYCICMGSYTVRETKAEELLPIWQAHVAGSANAQQQARLDFWAVDAKKRRGCRIEKF